MRTLMLPLLVAFTLVYATTYAQLDSLLIPFEKPVVKILPLGLADPIHAVLSMALEIPISNAHTLAIDGGYIHNKIFGIWTNNNPIQITGGFLIRPSFRYYFEDKERRLLRERKASNQSGTSNQSIEDVVFRFYEIQAFYKTLNSTYTGWVPINCKNQGSSYEKYDEIRYSRYAYGVNFIMGYSFKEQDYNYKIISEYYFGIGIRMRGIDILSSPNNSKCLPRDIEDRLFLSDNKIIPTLQLGARYGIELKRKK